MEKTDGEAFGAHRLKVRDGGRHRIRVEGFEHLAVDRDPFRHGETVPARDQGGGLLDHDVILVEPALVADLKHIPEPFGRQQRRKGALALDDRIGRKRRAVDDQADIPRSGPRAGQNLVDTGKHALFGCGGCRQFLCGEGGPFMLPARYR